MLGIAEMGGLLYEFQGIDGEKVKAQFEKSVEHQKELLADSARVNAELDDQLRQAQQLNGEIANANADVGKIAGRLNELKMQANSTATELSDVAAKQNAFGECTIDDIRAGDMSCVEIVADVIANRRQQLAEIGGVGQEAYAEQLRGIPNAVRSWLADPNRDAMSPEIQNALGILAKELEFSGATMVEYLQRTSTQLRSLADALGTQTAELQASHAQLMQGIQRMDALLASSRANTEVLGTKIGEITKELDTIAPIVTEYIKNAGYVTSAQAIWESMRTGTNNNLIDGVLKVSLCLLTSRFSFYS